jgi:hypothetical protein
MADQAAQWADVSDANTLKSILATQQAQLAQLQTQKPAPAPAAAGMHSDRKCKAVKLHDDECSDFEDNDELDQGLQADDEEYDPTNNSDYEEPKKKKKKQVNSAAAACRKHYRFSTGVKNVT